jgi:hypothetical protein
MNYTIEKKKYGENSTDCQVSQALEIFRSRIKLDVPTSKTMILKHLEVVHQVMNNLIK